MPTKHVRRATLRDIIELAPRLREADRRECLATLGMPPEVVMPLTFEDDGNTWTMLGRDGKAFGLFGVSPVATHPYFGIVWAVTTDDIYKNRRDFLRESRVWLDKLHDRYPLLGNHIDARNTVHVRWLKWMGFSFLRTIPDFGPEKRPFHEFARLRTSPPCVP